MFSRLMNLIRGFFSLFISGLEANNPKALIEAEKENLRSQISRFNENLANNAAFVERLRRQVRDLQQKEKELAAKIAANLKAGNKAVAGQLALQLQTVKQQSNENGEQLQMAEKTFKDLEKTRDVSLREAQAKIEKLQNLLSESEMMEAQAELQTMAKGMISGISLAGDSISRVTETIQQKHDISVGRARVAAGAIDTSGIQLKENEQAALGDQALAEFASVYGIDVNTGETSPASVNTSSETPNPARPVSEKEMGPTSK
ncbi:MAG: PspA/IM30 family protein [Candidatus Riflebacteria bacterium]|nr:PspA/IM30 family protein [Candidatus Riflebacteria bacterium]